MCPVYIILHGNPLLWTPNPPITSCIHQTFIEQFPGAPDGSVSACPHLPLTTPASASPHLAAGGFGWPGRRHTSVVYVKVPTLVWLRGIRVHETVSSASLPVQRASLQTKLSALRITKKECVGEGGGATGTSNLREMEARSRSPAPTSQRQNPGATQSGREGLVV